jgi:hypothetical protein
MAGVFVRRALEKALANIRQQSKAAPRTTKKTVKKRRKR